MNNFAGLAVLVFLFALCSLVYIYNEDQSYKEMLVKRFELTAEINVQRMQKYEQTRMAKLGEIGNRLIDSVKIFDKVQDLLSDETRGIQELLSIQAELRTVQETMLEKLNEISTEVEAVKTKRNVNIYDLSKSLEPGEVFSDILCRQSSMLNVSTTLCVHDPQTDLFVSKSIWKLGAWEPQVLRQFLHILLENPGLLVFDFGANVGQYTLFAASLRHYVIAVEPFYDNLLRIHKASRITKTFPLITLIGNALSDKPNELKKLQPVSFNIGFQNLVQHKNETYDRRNVTEQDQKYLVETITMDDLIEYLPLNYKLTRPKAIIKIDIEGFEAIAFQKAKKLFDTVEVCLVFIEWGHQAEQTSIHDLILEMIEFLYSHDLRPYALDENMKAYEQDRGNWTYWPWDIVWKKDGF